ncbi:Uncharacterised protein [Vibrio cholerae]|uniref:Uncharacterized protein n=1 Tax=Vibrio cholerae TaxID=666 RepID=A0A656AP91_VIBCL|nr:Uncharacterised protein [Vibrio cholerae]CSB20796.1 Uncharacterised protein [Vibrio cholerae]CSB59585.1 Uncharacterised protein [Vibrio cholerae]CSC27858.1 Uncharacterised protein [Vibrio cholerae]CSD24386.1 Uncharacterised protein [Vibrio cholerae]
MLSELLITVITDPFGGDKPHPLLRLSNTQRLYILFN